jgi:hypothetical protein
MNLLTVFARLHFPYVTPYGYGKDVALPLVVSWATAGMLHSRTSILLATVRQNVALPARRLLR